MTKIALLCPSRARPKQYKRMVDSVANTTNSTWYSLLAVSEEDAPSYHQDWSRLIVPDGMPTVHKWNVLAHEAMKDPDIKLFMLAADDIIFETKGWDEALIKHYEGLENKIHVYHLRDSRDSNGTPHPIVTREYIQAMGYFMPPIFLHWYVDTWTIDAAMANGCFSHVKEFLLTHAKPSDTGPGDETHNRIRRMGWHERDKYVNDTCQHMLELEKQRLGIAVGRLRVL